MKPRLMILQLSGLTICVALLTSCIMSRHPVGIASSTSPVPSAYTAFGPVEETSCAYQFLFIPVSGKAQTDEIITTLLKERAADAIIGVTVEQRWSVFALPIVGSDCTVVKGTLVKYAR
jgi:hypothetical protein